MNERHQRSGVDVACSLMQKKGMKCGDCGRDGTLHGDFISDLKIIHDQVST